MLTNLHQEECETQLKEKKNFTIFEFIMEDILTNAIMKKKKENQYIYVSTILFIKMPEQKRK